MRAPRLVECVDPANRDSYGKRFIEASCDRAFGAEHLAWAASDRAAPEPMPHNHMMFRRPDWYGMARLHGETAK